MRIATWNVLHRIHAENWRETVPDVFPDEAVRIAAITARIEALLADDDVVCLQEVSGDQLASLRTALPAMQVCAFIYPRVPSLKQPGPSPLQHPEEALVTIASRARLVAGAAFPNDPGKGFVVVDVDGVLIVNTHLSAGDRRTVQLQHIRAHVDHSASHSADQRSAVVVCGDCNTSSAKVLAALDVGFELVNLGLDALPTRPRPDLPDRSSDKPAAIDHIFVRGLVAEGGVVVDVDGTSDHNLVRATVREPSAA
jgi:endonuclease/exonuclease/phosphatase family metal-dependent hydrolase